MTKAPDAAPTVKNGVILLPPSSPPRAPHLHRAHPPTRVFLHLNSYLSPSLHAFSASPAPSPSMCNTAPTWTGDAAARGEILPPEMKASFGGCGGPRDWIPRDALGQRCEDLGNTYGIRIAFKNRIFTCQLQYIKAILSTQFTSFEKGPALRHIRDGCLCRRWLDVEVPPRLTRPFFDKHRISGFDNFDTMWKPRSPKEDSSTGGEHMGRVTLDSVSAFSSGTTSAPSRSPSPTHSTSLATQIQTRTDPSFAPAFLEAQDITNIRMRYLDFWPRILEDKIKEPMRFLERFLNPIVDGRGRQTEGGQERGCELWRKDPRGAGDPSRGIYCVTRVFERLGEKGRPTVEDIKEIEHLRAVLNETLRLYPPVPMNVRTSIEGVVLPPIKSEEKPFYIPPNTVVPYAPIMMHRRKDLWGPMRSNSIRIGSLTSGCTSSLFVPSSGAESIYLPLTVGLGFGLGQQPPESRVPDDWKTDDPSGWKRRRSSFAMSLSSFLLELDWMGGLWVTMEE
ncbi:cytochrome P450 [Mycena olivaceomarginata]|nr:cytochrome P450 [Mycena olivaceomarginata]